MAGRGRPSGDAYGRDAPADEAYPAHATPVTGMTPVLAAVERDRAHLLWRGQTRIEHLVEYLLAVE
jgi:hypothetical protein